MSNLVGKLAERLSPEEIEELAALLVFEAGETLSIAICDVTGQEIGRRTVKLHMENIDDRAIVEGLGVVREIVFDL